jgi:hypothetical protein
MRNTLAIASSGLAALASLFGLALTSTASAQDTSLGAAAAAGDPAAAPVASPAPAALPIVAPVSASESDAAAAALAASLQSDGTDTAVAEAQEFKLNVYGFTDFTYTQRLNHFTYASPYPTFMVGNVNLYVGAELGDGFRALTEFRLLYVPNGTFDPAQQFASDPVRTDTTVGDPADFGRPQRWGGVEIERAYLEYTVNPLLTLRGGQWLTPYGIWNVDHGSPVIIGVRRPYVVGEALIPEHQTGLMAYGAHLVGTTEIGYALGLSNGRGPVDTYEDLDNNKAFTAHVFVSNDSPIGTLTIGGSLYRGRYTDRSMHYVVDAQGALGVEYLTESRYDEFSAAGDLRWIWKNLTVQGEIMMRQEAIDDNFRAPAFPIAGRPPGFAPDFTSVGYYAMAAYRLPWLNIMPFFGGENYAPHQELNQNAAAVWGGLNVRPTPRVVLKAQLTRSWFTTQSLPVVGSNGLLAIDLQAAWSF